MESQRVINIVANDDYVPDYNFGYPCILHGVEAILDKLYGESGYHLTIYSHSDFRKKIIRDYPVFPPLQPLRNCSYSCR